MASNIIKTMSKIPCIRTYRALRKVNHRHLESLTYAYFELYSYLQPSESDVGLNTDVFEIIFTIVVH